MSWNSKTSELCELIVFISLGEFPTIIFANIIFFFYFYLHFRLLMVDIILYIIFILLFWGIFFIHIFRWCVFPIMSLSSWWVQSSVEHTRLISFIMFICS